jgi:hypothetical protein
MLTSATSSGPVADDAVQVLVAAYKVLDLELRASPLAIQYACRELLQLNQPERCPKGSPEQLRAAERRRAIEAAYHLIEHAPLRDHPLAHQAEQEQQLQGPRQDPALAIERTVSVLTETIVRFVLGMAAGVLLALWLERRGVPGFALYAWVVPLALGILFMSSLERRGWLVELLFWRP